MTMPLSFCTATRKDTPFEGWRFLYRSPQNAAQRSDCAAAQHGGRGAAFDPNWCGLKGVRAHELPEVIRSRIRLTGQSAS